MNTHTQKLLAGLVIATLAAPSLATGQTSFEDLIIHQVTGGDDHASDIASGDVNGDGIIDLAVTDPLWMVMGRSWVLIGPDFSTEIPIEVPNQGEHDGPGAKAGAWRLADVTGDGLDDLLMGMGGSKAGTETTSIGRALVFFAPDFTQSVELAHPAPGTKISFGTSMVAYDFTGDGVLDVAVSSPRAPGLHGALSAGRIDVFSGNDLGGPPVQTIVPPDPQLSKKWGWTLEIADWDKDGIDDLLVNDRPEGLLGDAYSWLSGMDPEDSYGFDLQPTSIQYWLQETLEDMDLDGHLDFIAGSINQIERAAIGYGPTFTQVTTFFPPPGDGTTNFGEAVHVGDVDRDGYPDLVLGMSELNDAANNEAVGRVDIRYGPDFETIQSFEGAHPFAQLGVGVHVVDLDGNGFGEVVMGAGAEFGGRVHLLRHSTLRIIGADELSISAGGAIRFSIEVGELSANRLYLVALGASGSMPGIDLPLSSGSVNLPLNPDALTTAALAKVNTPVYEDFLGTTSELGIPSAKLNVGPIPNPALAGTALTAAAVVFDPAGQVEYATDAAVFAIVP